MDVQEQLVARRVAEAADAWLRDPQDVEVYRRLVAAALAWRRLTARGTEARSDALSGDLIPATSDGAPGATPPDPMSRADLTADAEPEPEIPASRAPQPLGAVLGDVARALRARGLVADAPATESLTPDAPDDADDRPDDQADPGVRLDAPSGRSDDARDRPDDAGIRASGRDPVPPAAP